MNKEAFIGVAILDSKEFDMGCVHVNLCVVAENQWVACKKAEKYLEEHFYYGKGRLTALRLYEVNTPESFSNVNMEIIP